MAQAHHSKKKRHAKRRKHRHSVNTQQASTFRQKFIAIVLCVLMSLSLLAPVVFSIMQSSWLKSSHTTSMHTQPLTTIDVKDISKDVYKSFKDRIQPIKESLDKLLKEMHHLKYAEMGIPDVVYLHSRTSRFPTISAFPEVVEERLSDEDIAVDLSHSFDSNIVYDCSTELEEIFCRVVCREAGNQPFLGQLIVAEGVVSRVYSDAYRGNSTNAILKQGYSVEEDANGNLHIYDGNGKEILSYSEDTQKAVELALRGSRVSHTILKAVTEFQNAKYGLQLDDTTYSQWGAIYHYAPDYIRFERQFLDRNVRRAPVSFQFADHVFYGYWLPKSLQLNL